MKTYATSKRTSLGSTLRLHSEESQQTALCSETTQEVQVKVPSTDIVHIYCALIRSILEYASAVFADLPKYLACYLENVQKRALSNIWPGISYETALDKAVLSTLFDRRAVSCIKFIGKVRPGNPLYPLLHNRVVSVSTSVCLKSGSSSRPMATRTERCSSFVSVKC